MTLQFPTGQLNENKMQMDMCPETLRLFSLFHFPICISKTGLTTVITLKVCMNSGAKNKFNINLGINQQGS